MRSSLLAMRLCPLVAAAAMLVSATNVSFASTISSFTTGTLSNGNGDYVGDQFSVTSAGSYNNITFNFFSPSGAPEAAGTGYLFSAPFTGTESMLSSTSSNLIGTATSGGGVYSFGSDVTLTGGTTYYFYEDAFFNAGTVAAGFGAPMTTMNLFAPTGDSTFSTSGPGGTFNYAVNGDAVTSSAVTPEPASFALLGTGLLGMVGVMKRRFA